MKIKVELFSTPGCDRCVHAKDVLKKVIEDVDVHLIQWRAVDIIEEIDYAVELGVLSTPAIAINGELVFTTLPNQKKLRQTLEDRLKEKST